MFLLDTCTLLWYLYGCDDLSPKAREVIEFKECYFSYVSLWEIGIKQAKGLLDFDLAVSELEKLCYMYNFKSINITAAAIEQMELLPYHHKDPFDRLIIGQAKTNNLTIITSDTKIPLYDVTVLW